MSVSVSLPPVAPPLASETAVSQSSGPITPSSDQVRFISFGTTSASNSSWGPGGRTIRCMLCYLSFYLSLYPSPDRSNGSHYLWFLERSCHSEFHQPSQTFHYRLA